MAISFLVITLYTAFHALHCHAAQNENATDRQTVVPRRVVVADIALLIDQSTSIRQQYQDELRFAKLFTKRFPVGENETRFAVVQFSDEANTGVRLYFKDGVSSSTLDNIFASMSGDTLYGDTDFAAAFRQTRTRVQKTHAGDRQEAPTVVVLVTDGRINDGDQRKTFAEAKLLRETGAVIYAVHVDQAGVHPKQDLATITGSSRRVFATSNFAQLADTLLPEITKLVSESFDNCVYKYVPTGPCRSNNTDLQPCYRYTRLVVEQQPVAPHGRACPAKRVKMEYCSRRECEETCESWSWGAWTPCFGNGLRANGTRMRVRNGQPPGNIGMYCDYEDSEFCIVAAGDWGPFNNGTLFDNGTLFGNGTLFDNGTLFNNGTLFENGTFFYNGTRFGNGTLFDNGTLFNNRSELENSNAIEFENITKKMRSEMLHAEGQASNGMAPWLIIVLAVVGTSILVLALGAVALVRLGTWKALFDPQRLRNKKAGPWTEMYNMDETPLDGAQGCPQFCENENFVSSVK